MSNLLDTPFFADPALDPVAKSVLEFWFSDQNQPFWFAKSDEFDRAIADQFLTTWQAAKACECDHWRVSMAGRLAEIIVLDQFSRNLQRDSATAFAQDPLALALAQEAVKQADYENLPSIWCKFIIMPYMHSESRKIHAEAVALFEALNDDYTMDFELRHKAIVDRFGRYPHRNQVLGRTSSPEELEFLTQAGSSF